MSTSCSKQVFVLLAAGIMSSCLQTGLAATRTWTGAADMNWFNGNNWSPAQVPTNGDTIIVDASASRNVLLTNFTANLASFSISNRTLTCSNWVTRIQATDFVIRNGAQLTLPGAFTTNTMMSNRVWIVCSNFTLQTGGQIAADGKGYQVGRGPGSPGLVGGSTASSGGGYGGRGADEGSGIGGPTYGLTNAPYQPGSGGRFDNVDDTLGTGGAGGGAVRIQATNVTVNGTIAASGTTAPTYSGGGSGGSVYITCRSFSATNGVIRVNGGNGGGGYVGGGGGGGRIAIVYDTISGNPVLELSATAGASYLREAAGHGTVYLSDALLVNAATLGARFKDVRLVIPGFSTWSVGSLVLSNRTVSVGEKGFRLTVTNDLTVRNGASLVLGGIPLAAVGSLSAGGGATNPWLRVGGNLTLNSGSLLLGGREQNSYTRLSVGGTLLLTNGGQLVVYSGNTNGTYTNGALVTVTGNMVIASGSWFKPLAQPVNGGTPMLTVSNLTIRAGGGVDASGGGYKSFGTNVFGPGQGVSAGSRGGGAGYGGKGGRGENGSAVGGPTYGVTNAPVLPGSGGAYGYEPQPGNAYGGGSVQIWGNVITLDGTIQANGGSSQSQYGGGGSGGGVVITCSTFQGATTGVLRADGGTGGSVAGGGGGGRVAVGIDMPAAKRRQIHRGQAPSGVVAYTNHGGYFGQLTAIGGSGGGYTPLPGKGTVFFLTTNTVLTIMGSPATYGAPMPQGYGSAGYRGTGTRITNSVAPPANVAGGQRWQCTGWRLKRLDETPVSNGSSTQAVFQLTTNMVLTWKWTNEYHLSVASGANGTAAVSKTGWYTNGVAVGGISANANTGYVFDTWTGDVPSGHETDNPVSVTMDRTRSIVASFVSAVGANKKWTGSGTWETGGNWSPAGMPGSNDTCTLASGTCILSSARKVSSLVISNGATLLMTNWSTRLTAGQVSVHSGGTITLPVPNGLGRPTNRIYIVTTRFDLRAGGLLNADGRGYWVHEGPGKGDQSGSNNNGGGGHGGRGGDENGGMGGVAYDSVSAPSLPGSGGGQYLSNSGGSGGGVIRIQATNCVVAGTISANGEAGSTYNGGGSGGSVYITCQSFTGTGGVIRANGGNGGSSYGGGGGGGGRIAVVYQAIAGTPDVQFAAGAGSLYHYHPPAMGTVYLPDTALLSQNISAFKNVRLSIPSFSSWTVASLTISNASFSFSDSNFTLNVSNDMIIRNSGWLSVGGVALCDGQTLGNGIGLTNGILRVGGNLSLNASRLTLSGPLSRSRCVMSVGRDFTLSGGAAFQVNAGPTNSPETAGAWVTVTGAVMLSGNSWVYPRSQATNGAPVLFRMSNLVVSADSGFNADGLGYNVSAGPGKGQVGGSPHNSGGGYGGRGGDSDTLVGGNTYGNTNYPVCPGSGGGRYDDSSGRGGGLIWIETDRDIQLDGRLSADGQNGGAYNGGGSGGAIMVRCGGRLTGGTNAVIRARGGARGSGYTTIGGGGGGRVAVWIQAAESEKPRILAGDKHRLVFTNSWKYFFGTMSATNGTSYKNPPDPAAPGPGTALFLIVMPKAGTLLIVR